jgi:hypothetical protein
MTEASISVIPACRQGSFGHYLIIGVCYLVLPPNMRPVYQINLEDTKEIISFFAEFLVRFSSIPLDHKAWCFSTKGPVDFLD